MKRFGACLMVWCFAQLSAEAGSRFAVIRFADIVRELPSYKQLNEKTEAAKSKIEADVRNTKLKETLAALEAAVGELKKMPNKPDNTAKVELARKIESLKQEANALWEDFNDFKAAETTRIKEELLAASVVIETRVRDAAAKLAAERGFDCLFDAKGCSNTAMPVLIYAKEPADLTADVLAAVKAAEIAASGEAAPAPTDPNDGKPQGPAAPPP